MTLTASSAMASTCGGVPGPESTDDKGSIKIEGRAFTGLVQSDDWRIAGTSTPVLDIVIDPTSGEGELRGSFIMQPKDVDGAWEGRMQGRIREGLVTAWGLARGTG